MASKDVVVGDKRRRSDADKDTSVSVSVQAPSFNFDDSVKSTQLQLRSLEVGHIARVRSIAANVSLTVETLAASTESRRQQIEQQRHVLLLAVNERIDKRLETLHAESALRTSTLERQLVDTDNALETMQRHKAAAEAVIATAIERKEFATKATKEYVYHTFDMDSSIESIPQEPVEIQSMEAHLDTEHVLCAIDGFGVVFGAQAASMLYARAFALLIGRDGVFNAAAAFALFTDAAAQGNTTAMGYAAAQLYAGFGVNKDGARALGMFKEAAKHGDLYSRAMVLLLIDKSDENSSIALSLLRHAASSGHVAAEHEMGVCYLRGVGCEIDEEAACKHFRQASDQKYALAQCELALCYKHETGVDKDFVLSTALFRLAADQGYAEAQNYLGVCFDDGNGVDKDPVQAAAWYKLAAENGNQNAQYNLGVCYDGGRGVNADPVQAAVWYRRAADQGDADAQNSLGSCYFYGKGLDKDFAQAFAWFTLAAEQGHAEGQLNLGMCYANGRGVVRDGALAVVWFTRSADQGRADAQRNLGVSFYRGAIANANSVQAVTWFTRAAEQGDAAAMYYLGECYATGNGVDKEFTLALAWYTRAADLGYEKAQLCLARIHDAALPIIQV